MGNFAVIKDGIVENIIVCDSKEIAEEVTGLLCVEYTSEEAVFIGLGWSEADGFEVPALPPMQTPEVPDEPPFIDG